MDSSSQTLNKINLNLNIQSSQNIQTKEVDELVIKILTYRNKTNGRVYDTINQDYLLNLLDKTKIIEIEKSFPTKGLDIIDFVRLFLNNIPHREDETLYLAISLIDLFKRISENLNLSSTIQMKHITSVICDRMQEKNSAQYKIQTVLMPEPQKFRLDASTIRSIDIDPPPIYGRYDDDLQRLVKQKIKTDSMHHLNHRIKTGVYAKDIKRIISLDSLSDRINMYSIDCELKQFIRPKSNQPQEKISSDIIIFSFAWSERQERLGATLKDFSLCFWDRSDNFKYEKQISIQSFMSDYQTNIWYLEFPNCWVTTDAKNQLYEWDLEKEIVKRTLSSPKIKHTIFEVIEIPELKLVAVGSSDRLITIWDFNKGSMVQCIEFFKAGIHSVVYFKSYQVLVCGGFQNNISLHQIDPKYLDVNNKGLLIGHQSMITAIDCVEKTPMIISSDDSGTIKIWDIRTLKCIQTVDCGQRTVITKIINLYPKGRLCFLGTRINVIDFDEADLIIKKTNNQDDTFPIKVENNSNDLIVVTRKDIRFVDIDTGKIKQIFVGLLNDAEDEITAFKQIEQGSKFILGNHRGEISLHSIQNGELINKLHSHQNEVTSIRIDYLNKLLISAGWDSNIKIQYLTDSGSDIKREIINCFYNKEVTIVEVSVYHNLLFAASNSEFIYVFDYEFAKLLYCIELENKVEVQAMSVVNGFSLLLISANNGFIYIINFSKKEYLFTARLIGYIDIPQLIKYHQSEEKEDLIPNLAHNPQIQINSQDSLQIPISQFVFQSQTTKNLASPNLALRIQKTNIDQYNYINSPLTQSPSQFQNTNAQNIFTSTTQKIIAANRFILPQISSVQHQSTLGYVDKNQNSPQRLSCQYQDEQQLLQQQQQQQQTIQQLQQPEVPNETQNSEIEQNDQSKKVIFVNKILLDTQINEEQVNQMEKNNQDQVIIDNNNRNISSANSNRSQEQVKLTKFILYCSLNKGDLLGIDLLPFCKQFDNITYTEHCNQRINYNAFRGNTENFLKSIEQIKNEKMSQQGQLKVNSEGRKCSEKQLNQSIYKNIIFYKQGAHKDILTSLKMINLKEPQLLTSSMDCFIKVWNKDTGDLKASLNINHPLPLMWNIEKDIIQDGKKKIVFALKILDVIYKKYGKELSFQEQRKVKVTDFLANILSSQIDSEIFTQNCTEKKEQLYEKLRKIPITEWISKLVDPKEYKGEIILMKDQYSPRDLKYEKSKQFFQTELTGPSLKRMEANKRVAMATKAWKQENESKEAELENQLRNENNFLKNYKYEEREEIVQFLEANYRDKLINNEFSKILEEFSKPTQDFQKKLDLHLFQKKTKQMIQAQMNSSNQNQFEGIIKKRNTKAFINHNGQLQSQTNLQQNNQNQQRLSYQSDKQSLTFNQDAQDNNELLMPALISKRRQQSLQQVQKIKLKDSIDETEFKKKKLESQKKKQKEKQIEKSMNFYEYANQKQLINQKLSSPSLFQNNQHLSFINKHLNQSQNTKIYQNQILDSTIDNQSTVLQANTSQIQNEFTVMQENSQVNDIHQSSQINIPSAMIKNNSTTIGNNSTVLNMSQEEVSQINEKGFKEGIHKMNKLSQVLRNMDSRIKRAQQHFNDDSIISAFLQKRNEINQQLDQNELSINSQQKDKDSKLLRASMNSSSILPQIKITDQSHINNNTSQLTDNNSMMLKDIVKEFDSKGKNQFQSISTKNKHQKSSQILTKNGLDVLKKLIYDVPSNDKKVHYMNNNLKGNISKRSNLNQSTPNLFTYQINSQKKINYLPVNNQSSSSFLHNPNESDELLLKIQDSLNQQPIVAQKLLQYKKTLNSNIQNAFNLYQRIEDSLASVTPVNINQQKDK
ncbi:WD domain, G-beta repeat protein (macronuclear) [Tetrahymena thermophila SB210]|uniref:WD domain, G-beta repeat protein n=1 Tax=Tetrahymena thermophila (strain SB210) TaxID=312017 RepID=Q22SA9_TETTS|nr:WD domain, G-beta repeat protein [Tetrahymena thermophila SB210]EAR87863.2 WD domain, G-beta repeat protein [Tetrahymena thermophila SB210]|eukprot:XP_001008108.2 WD domain, G-beta repeat protein [Tetrahymena thermophila SB210]